MPKNKNPNPSDSTRKKSKKPLIIIVVVILVLCVAGVASYLLFFREDAPLKSNGSLNIGLKDPDPIYSNHRRKP